MVYYVLSLDFNVYMDIQQGINPESYRRISEEGVELAYPGRTVHVHGAAATQTG